MFFYWTSSPSQFAEMPYWTYKYAHHPSQAVMQGFLAIMMMMVMMDVCPACVCTGSKEHTQNQMLTFGRKADYAGDTSLQLPRCKFSQDCFILSWCSKTSVIFLGWFAGLPRLYHFSQRILWVNIFAVHSSRYILHFEIQRVWGFFSNHSLTFTTPTQSFYTHLQISQQRNTTPLEHTVYV